jgi:ABC-type glycerol-3-phosphate transport system permease component
MVRLIPPIVATLPLFPVASALGLRDTHVLLAVLYATFFVSLGSFVMRAFIDQIPEEMDEAAAVDGAGRFTTLWRVITPLAAQGMMAVAVFVVVHAWNEFLFAFIFTSTRAKTSAAGAGGGGGQLRWCRMGNALRRCHRTAAARTGRRLDHAEIPGGGADRRHHQGMTNREVVA